MEENLEALALCGHWVSYGQVSGPLPPIGPEAPAAKSVTLSCPVLFHYTAERAALNEIAQQTFEALRAGVMRVERRHRYPLAAAAEAHRDLEGGAPAVRWCCCPSSGASCRGSWGTAADWRGAGEATRAGDRAGDPEAPKVGL